MPEWTQSNYGDQWHCFTPAEACYYTGDEEIDDETIVVARNYQEAQEFYAELYQKVHGEKPDGYDSWTALKHHVSITAYDDGFFTRDAHTTEALGWSRDGRPWLLNDPDSDIHDCEPDYEDDGLEGNDYRVGVQRDCVCADEETLPEAPPCPICGGEKKVTRWVGVSRIEGVDVTLKDDLENKFADLAAYKLLKERGYSVTKPLT